eukprot:969157_1
MNDPKEIRESKEMISSGDQIDSVDLKIPLSLLMSGTSSGSNECTVLVQVNPEDASTLDFHGAGGAVGRFEVNENAVIMDLKGFQYQGNLEAGPTCLMGSMHPLMGERMIKIESITDEFVQLQKTGDHMAQLDAVVEKGEMDDSFRIKDNNVNSKATTKCATNCDDRAEDIPTVDAIDKLDARKSRARLRRKPSDEIKSGSGKKRKTK